MQRVEGGDRDLRKPHNKKNEWVEIVRKRRGGAGKTH